MDWGNFFAAFGSFITLIGTVAGGWYLRILSRREKIRETQAKQKLAETQTTAAIELQKLTNQKENDKKDRKDANEEAWVLIGRLQDIHKADQEEMACLRIDIDKAKEDCEERERAAIARSAKLEKQYGRAVERIRMIESQIASKVRGWTLPPFKEELDLDEGSGTHSPLIS